LDLKYLLNCEIDRKKLLRKIYWNWNNFVCCLNAWETGGGLAKNIMKEMKRERHRERESEWEIDR
jgi:hypothetical protein